MTVERTPSGSRGLDNMPIPRQFSGIFNAAGVAAYHLFGGKKSGAGPFLCVLTTTGAQTGSRRKSPLLCFTEPDGAWLVVASSGGMKRHPGWFFNLVKNPNDPVLEVGKERFDVRAESLPAEERDQAWQRIISLSPRYAGYQEKTDRQIPIVRLSRRS